MLKSSLALSARAVVIVPTLKGGPHLDRAVARLRAQTFRDFLTVIVDNSGSGAARPLHSPPAVVVIENPCNVGFGEAVNQGLAAARSEYVCTLNDDAYARPDWLRELVAAADADPATVGMCASQIRLADAPSLLDSAGLDIYPDGTTKQRGRGEPAAAYAQPADALLPSGCAALYRREMIEQAGGFDRSYFLYCEDSDLGLRARLAGWRCRYVPSAVVEHDYSRSTGRASARKAFYVERNRLYTVAKTFPPLLWPAVPLFSIWRYILQVAAALLGRGLTADIRREQGFASLARTVFSAHRQAAAALPRLLRTRRSMRLWTTLGTWRFLRLLRRHSVSAWEIALQ